jgi:2-deoxy-D-gluconate 3-dehydrogenase
MIDKLFDLQGKLAVVTGCKRGIGYAMAEGLAAAGADIVGVSATLAEGSAIAQAFAKRVLQAHGTPDILVNNAGTILRKPAAEHPDAYWDEVIEVNLNAQFVLAREFGRAMLERGSGKVIFTASLLSFQGGITVPGYAASKGAIKQLTMALSNEWAGRGVQVNAIAPGYIATDNTQALQDDPERSAAILSRIPAGRWGTPDDFKGPIVFLASAASDYMSGAVLTIDGGWMGR